MRSADAPLCRCNVKFLRRVSERSYAKRSFVTNRISPAKKMRTRRVGRSRLWSRNPSGRTLPKLVLWEIWTCTPQGPLQPEAVVRLLIGNGRKVPVRVIKTEMNEWPLLGASSVSLTVRLEGGSGRNRPVRTRRHNGHCSGARSPALSFEAEDNAALKAAWYWSACRQTRDPDWPVKNLHVVQYS
jgi:hypothetical protein